MHPTKLVLPAPTLIVTYYDFSIVHVNDLFTKISVKNHSNISSIPITPLHEQLRVFGVGTPIDMNAAAVVLPPRGVQVGPSAMAQREYVPDVGYPPVHGLSTHSESLLNPEGFWEKLLHTWSLQFCYFLLPTR